MRSVLAAALVVVLVLPWSGVAAAQGSEAQPLAGTNRVSGDATTRVRVFVARDAIVDLTPVADEQGRLRPKALRSADGEGFVGFMLVSPGATPAVLTAAVQLPAPLRDGDVTSSGAASGTSGSPAVACVRCNVPAGPYNLYLIASEGRATISFDVAGLGGMTELSTGRNALWSDAQTKEWMSSSFLAAGAIRQWFWTQSTGTEPGLLVDVYEVAAETPTVAFGSVSACRSAGQESTCIERRFSGRSPRASGVMFTMGHMTESGVEATADVSVAGATSVRLSQAMLWVPFDHWVPGASTTRSGGTQGVRQS